MFPTLYMSTVVEDIYIRFTYSIIVRDKIKQSFISGPMTQTLATNDMSYTSASTKLTWGVNVQVKTTIKSTETYQQ